MPGRISSASSEGRSARPIVTRSATTVGPWSSRRSRRSRMRGRTSSVRRCPFRSRSTNTSSAASTRWREMSSSSTRSGPGPQPVSSHVVDVTLSWSDPSAASRSAIATTSIPVGSAADRDPVSSCNQSSQPGSVVSRRASRDRSRSTYSARDSAAGGNVSMAPKGCGCTVESPVASRPLKVGISPSTDGTLGRLGSGTLGSETDGSRSAARVREGMGIAGRDSRRIDAIDAAACPGSRRRRSCNLGLPGSSS